jgi:leader peptidase (prepilin peptidase)/N-methyltransferase
LELYTLAIAFALGAIIGSFLNVVIYRYPREESVAFPASHCPSCNAAIKPYDNVPILSYIWLRGRCRSCRTPFSARYPLVELANALFYVAILQRTGLRLLFLPVAAIVSMTIVLIFIDAEIQILPDVITLPGIAIGIAMSALENPSVHADLLLAKSLKYSLLGAAAGALLIALLIAAYWLLRGIEGMGWGDAKMMAMIGAVLGAYALPGVLFLASLAGAVVGIPVAMRRKEGMQAALPFGIFLGLATLGLLFFGPTLIEWWVRRVLLS